MPRSTPDPPATRTTIDAAVRAAVESPERPPEDRARDATSRPADVLAFFGVAPGMRVLDLNAATGYFTEILSRAVGMQGRVIAVNHPGARTLLRPGDVERRYAGGRLANASQLFAAHNELALPAASLDFVLMSLVYHDTYWHDPNVSWGPIDRPALLRSLRDALAPGGTVGVIDHCAAPGTDPSVTAIATHRIDPAVVMRDFAAAGLAFDAASDVLRNDQDDYDANVFAPAIARRTDRFAMRFRRGP